MIGIASPHAVLFPTARRYLLALGIGGLACVLLSGLLRHQGDPGKYPLWRVHRSVPRPAPRTFDPASDAFRTWIHWRALDTGDFRPVFEASRARRTGGSMYRPEELSEHSASFVYTPFTALLVAPLAYRQVTPAQAAHVASLINHVLAVVAFGFLVLVITGGGRPALGEGLLYALHFVVFYPLAKAMQLTQASVWIFFFLTASGFLLARGRHTASGVALALGVSIKPHLIVIPLLLAVLPQFPRRMIYSCAAGLLATGVASLWYAGMSDTRAYLFETLPTLAAGYAYFPNQSAGGILLRSFTPQNPAVFNLSVSVPWVKVAAVVYALALLGLTGLAFRSRRVAEHEDTALLGYSAAVIAATLASPVLWEHHFTALMLPLATVVRHLRAHPHRRTRVLDAGMLVSFLLIAVFIDTRYLHGWPIALLSGFQHYGGLLLLACVAWLMRRVDG